MSCNQQVLYVFHYMHLSKLLKFLVRNNERLFLSYLLHKDITQIRYEISYFVLPVHILLTETMAVFSTITSPRKALYKHFTPHTVV